MGICPRFVHICGGLSLQTSLTKVNSAYPLIITGELIPSDVSTICEGKARNEPPDQERWQKEASNKESKTKKACLGCKCQWFSEYIYNKSKEKIFPDVNIVSI